MAVEAGLLTPRDAKGLGDPNAKVAGLVQMLLEKGLTDEEITMLLACANQLPYVPLDRVRLERSAVDLVPGDLQQRYGAVPLKAEKEGDMLYVAVVPWRAAAISNFLTKILRISVVPVAASPGAIKHALSVLAGLCDEPTASAPSVEDLDLDLPAAMYECFTRRPLRLLTN